MKHRDHRTKKDVISISFMAFSATATVMSSFTRSTRAAVSLYTMARTCAATCVSIAAAFIYRGTREDVYNILWAVVFGFATLNILSLAARRFEPQRRGLTFGELLAVVVVLIAIILLGWEMLTLFHVFPIRLRR
jgi:hypothetical protein